MLTLALMLMVTVSFTLRVPMDTVTECASTDLLPFVVVTDEVEISRKAGSASRKATLVAGAAPRLLIMNWKLIVWVGRTSKGVAVAVITIKGVIVPVAVWVGVGPVGVRVGVGGVPVTVDVTVGVFVAVTV